MKQDNLETIDWDGHGPGIGFKQYEQGDKRVGLMEFSKGFRDEGHCLNGHMVNVLDGKLSIQFDDALEKNQTGETSPILPGEDDRHKEVMGSGDTAPILSLETRGDR